MTAGSWPRGLFVLGDFALCTGAAFHRARVNLAASARKLPRLDGHVHLVGNGLSGSGCWIRMSGWHRFMGKMITRMIRMPVGFEDARFDEIYVERLRSQVEESSLDQVLLLAQDEVYQQDGSKRNFGSFHVPNDYQFSVFEAHP